MSEENSSNVSIISIIPPDVAFASGGLPDYAICGWVKGEEYVEENFIPNPAFVDYMHGVIEKYGPDDPGLIQAAQRQQDGWLYIIDARTPDPENFIPPTDIIGVFALDAGTIVEGSYQRNKEHKIYSGQSLVQLPPYIENIIIAEVAAE